MSRRTLRLAVLIVSLVALLLPASVSGQEDPAQPTTRADCMKEGWRDYPHLGFRNQGDCIRFVQTGVLPCIDPVGCVTYSRGQPVRLATALPTSEPFSFFGIDQLRGVELALADHGPIFGHQVELRNEDTMCSPDGGVLAATAIVADARIAAVVGTACAGAAVVAAPIISAAGYTMVSPSASSPLLTSPATHSAGFLRVSWNDRDQPTAMASFVHGEGAATSAVVIEDNAYSRVLGEAFVTAFESLGGVVLAFEIAAADGSDAAAVLDAIMAAGPLDVLYMPVFPPLGAALVLEAAAEIPSMQLAATDVLANPELLPFLGPAAEGMLFTVPDLAFFATPGYTTFASAYLAAYGEEPLTLFAAYAYDATQVVLAAIEATATVGSAGSVQIGRQALRDALFATAGFDGLTGTITCDAFGDCGATGFEILEAQDGALVPAG